MARHSPSVTTNTASAWCHWPSASRTAPRSMRSAPLCSSSRMPRRWKIARNRRRAAWAWPIRISSLVTSVTCSSAAFATSRRRWSIASASSTPPAPPPITMTLSGPSQVFMRPQNSSQRRPSSAIGFTGIALVPLLDRADVGRRADVDRQQVVVERRLILQSTRRVARSMPVASAWTSRAWARWQSRARSMWHSSKL